MGPESSDGQRDAQPRLFIYQRCPLPALPALSLCTGRRARKLMTPSRTLGMCGGYEEAQRDRLQPPTDLPAALFLAFRPIHRQPRRERLSHVYSPLVRCVCKSPGGPARSPAAAAAAIAAAAARSRLPVGLRRRGTTTSPARKQRRSSETDDTGESNARKTAVV
jgi:hypothetical protein